MKYLGFVLCLFIFTFQANPLLQKPEFLSQNDITKLEKNWETSFNWNFGKGCNFSCWYEKDAASFLLQVMGLPVRSHKFGYIAALKKYFTTPTYQHDYFLAKPLKYEHPQPQTMEVSECYEFIKNKKFIFYTGAGISAGAVATMGGLMKALPMSEGKAHFLKEVFLNPSHITQAFKEFCRTAIYAKPTNAHHAVAKIAVMKEVAIMTENVDLLQHRTGVKPIFSHSDAMYAVTQKDLSEVDAVVCIGLSHDDCGFLSKYKNANPQGTLVSIDLGMPNYLSTKDFLVKTDIQTTLPTLAEKFS